LLLIFCLLLAVGLTYAQYAYFSSPGQQEERVEVLVAKQPIAAGERVEQGRLGIKNIPVFPQ
jgi:Flp pilus assembly protein CpaB